MWSSLMVLHNQLSLSKTTKALSSLALLGNMCFDPPAAESQALLETCQLINRLKRKNDIFELDCLNAINFISNLHAHVNWSARAHRNWENVIQTDFGA